jgi:hypothetical protein
VDATFSFDLTADSQDGAKALARALLSTLDVVNDERGTFNVAYDAPFVAVAGQDTAFPSLRADEVTE